MNTQDKLVILLVLIYTTFIGTIATSDPYSLTNFESEALKYEMIAMAIVTLILTYKWAKN